MSTASRKHFRCGAVRLLYAAAVLLLCGAVGCDDPAAEVPAAEPQQSAALVSNTQSSDHPSPTPTQSARRVLRVAADPNNLPFTNDRLEGFENKIAELVAQELGAELQYVWRAQRRGFLRETIKAGTADLVLGLPGEVGPAAATDPYYRSAYVFVWRSDRNLGIRSFDDPKLRDLKVGVQLIGDDGADSPPAHALARRGVVDNVVGFTVYGDYAQPNPPARIIDAVAKGEVDVAVVWGPLAGYFAKQQSVELTLVPVSPQLDPPALPLAFDISMGVRRKDKALRLELNEILARKRTEIERILDEYGVPRVPTEAGATLASDDDDDDDDEAAEPEGDACCG